LLVGDILLTAGRADADRAWLAQIGLDADIWRPDAEPAARAGATVLRDVLSRRMYGCRSGNWTPQHRRLLGPLH
jgi:murein endopeptidase